MFGSFVAAVGTALSPGNTAGLMHGICSITLLFFLVGYMVLHYLIVRNLISNWNRVFYLGCMSVMGLCTFIHGYFSYLQDDVTTLCGSTAEWFAVFMVQAYMFRLCFPISDSERDQRQKNDIEAQTPHGALSALSRVIAAVSCLTCELQGSDRGF